MYGNYPINVKCLQQAFHIDWVVYFKNFLPISKLPNQCMETSQSMWIACCKHYTLIGYFSFSITHIGKNFTHWLGTFQIIPWKLPNQSEMLAHPPCASISHWLGRYLVTLNQEKPLWHFENCLINVKCLRTPPVQAFHIDWVVLIDLVYLKTTQYFLKTTQSMWNACTGGVRKHFTLIG